jgi:hypothetical protein
MLERADTAEAIGLNQRASTLLDHLFDNLELIQYLLSIQK